MSFAIVQIRTDCVGKNTEWLFSRPQRIPNLKIERHRHWLAAAFNRSAENDRCAREIFCRRDYVTFRIVRISYWITLFFNWHAAYSRRTRTTRADRASRRGPTNRRSTRTKDGTLFLI